MTSTFNEHQLQLALQTLERDPQLGIREIVRLYKILHSILSYRINSRSIYTDIIFNLQKLTVLEEEVVVRKVFDLNSQIFLPRIYNMKDMVNRLLAIYDATYVGLR